MSNFSSTNDQKRQPSDHHGLEFEFLVIGTSLEFGFWNLEIGSCLSRQGLLSEEFGVCSGRSLYEGIWHLCLKEVVPSPSQHLWH
jgi:hypothetical protein